MELAYHLYVEDLNKINELMRSTDLLRENNMIEIIGRYMLCQVEGNEKYSLHGSDTKSVFQKGLESARSTIDESPDPKEIDECDEQVQRPL